MTAAASPHVQTRVFLFMKEIAVKKWAWISIGLLEKLHIRVNGSGLKSLPDTLMHEAGGITGKLKGLIGNH